MADKKISELTAATALDGTEPLPIVQAGETRKATVAQLSTGRIVTDATSARTMTAADNGRVIRFTSATPVTVSCPTGLAVGFNCTFIQIGAGKVTIAAGAGATLQAYSNLVSTIGANAVASVMNVGSEVFIATGNLGV